jgi:DNA polymerase, archaea type
MNPTMKTVTEKKKLYNCENRRELAFIEDDYINIDETQLDLFDYYKGTIKDWKPKNYDIQPFKKLSTVAFDIETTGGVIPGSKEIDAVNHKITLIGAKNEKGRSLMWDALADERYALEQFFEMLKKKKPDILYGHNIFYFDIPFIIKRCEILGINHPFWIPPYNPDYDNKVRRTDAPFGHNTGMKPKYATKTRSTCQIGSRAIEYTPVWLTLYDYETGTKHHCAIIDTYHEVLAWDFVKRSLTEYKLKLAPVQMELVEDDEITDIPYSQMLEEYKIWEDGGRVRMMQYLESDLNLTKILGDYLFPSIYYQKMFLDWKLQSLASSGNGSKWNCLIRESYPSDYVAKNNIVTFKKHRFKGAYTLAFAGLFGGKTKKKEVCKIDVASLYPTVMLLYGIHSLKDKDGLQLAILNWLRTERLILKDVSSKTGDIDADQMQGVMKILINSGYGSLGTQGIEFNDYVAAALVTAYARGIFRILIDSAKKFGGKLVSCDTDGIIVEVDEGKSQTLTDYIQSKLPGKGTKFPITIELEWVAKTVFVPESDNQVFDISLVDPDEGFVRAGLKKNYIIVLKEKLGKDGKVKVPDGKLKYNGKYRKRDRCVLDKRTQPDLVQIYTQEGETAMRKYYRDTKKQLMNKDYPYDNLKITRKIRKGEKNIVRQGIGLEGEFVTIWKSHNVYKIGKKGLPIKAIDIDGWTKEPKPESINWDFYIEKLDTQFAEVAKYI